jgi:hypothetical protein
LVSDVLDPAGADRADLAADAVLTWQHLGDLLLDPAVTGLPLATPTVLALTGLQGQPDSIGLFEFAGRVMTDPRLPILLFCAGTGETPEIRACCRTAGAEDPGTPAAPEV